MAARAISIVIFFIIFNLLWNHELPGVSLYAPVPLSAVFFKFIASPVATRYVSPLILPLKGTRTQEHKFSATGRWGKYDPTSGGWRFLAEPPGQELLSQRPGIYLCSIKCLTYRQTGRHFKSCGSVKGQEPQLQEYLHSAFGSRDVQKGHSGQNPARLNGWKRAS